MAGACAIGIDIGGTHTKAGLLAADGTLAQLVRFPTASHTDPAPYLERLRSLVSDWLGESPLGIGLSLPGFHSEDRRSIAFNPNTPALVGIDFLALFESFRLPVRIEQDLNTPVISEHALGVGRGLRRFMTATMGTGAGAGVMIDGQVLRFTGNSAGDTGHIILEPGGPACDVGCRGCAEALVTIPAVEREARLRLGGTPFAAASPDGLTAARVIEAARDGDPQCMDIMRLIGQRIGLWLASLAPIFLPERIALCGGIMEAGAVTIDACRARFLELAGPEYARCDIVLGRFRGLSGIVGAAAPFLAGPDASPA